MRPITKNLIIVAGVYLALWSVTRLSATWVLERQLQEEARVVWEHYHGYSSVKEGGLMAFAGGPHVEVELLSCPAPFVFRAECETTIGPLNGSGTIGLYILTPWRAYVISENITWIS